MRRSTVYAVIVFPIAMALLMIATWSVFVLVPAPSYPRKTPAQIRELDRRERCNYELLALGDRRRGQCH